MTTLVRDFEVRRMVKFEGSGSLKAFCDLAIGDQFLVKGLRVVQGKHGLFVSFPRQQGKDSKWYNHVEALTKEVKEDIDRVVLDSYQQQFGAE